MEKNDFLYGRNFQVTKFSGAVQELLIGELKDLNNPTSTDIITVKFSNLTKSNCLRKTFERPLLQNFWT